MTAAADPPHARPAPRAGLLAAALALALAALALAVPVAEAKPKSFQSPNGNIGCYISGKGARCDIKRRDWSPPPTPASCELDYGFGVFVDRRGPAGFVCAGDTVIDRGARVLRRGDSISRGRFRCVSRKRKIKCVNDRNERGFKLSRQRVKLL